MNHHLTHALPFSRRGLAAISLAVLFTGCTVGPNYKEPKIPVPDKFHAAPTTQVATTQVSAVLPPADLTHWWTSFNDPVLNQLIQQAVKENLDLVTAQARVRQVRAQLGIAGAAEYPTLDAKGSYRHTRGAQGTGTSGVNATGGAGGTETIVARTGTSERDIFIGNFDASWELDVFGGTRRNIEAARADLGAQIASRNDTLVTLTAEVARFYVDLRGLQEEIRIAQQNLEAQRQTMELTRVKFNAGVASDLDVARAEAQVATTAATIPNFEAQALTDIHHLAVLTAKEPGALLNELTPVAPLPYSVPAIPVGLPSELLRRRPDIRVAERQLAAATARIGVAEADYYPKFSLNGSLGSQADTFKNMFRTSSIFYSIGPDVSWRIFDAGTIRFNVEVQNALQEQFLAQYKKVILVALEDVENSLVNFNHEQTRNSSLQQAVASNRRAVDLATQLYNKGLNPFLDVLDAQRNLFAVEDQLSVSQRALSVDLVAVYKALGGGWQIQ